MILTVGIKTMLKIRLPFTALLLRCTLVSSIWFLSISYGTLALILLLMNTLGSQVSQITRESNKFDKKGSVRLSFPLSILEL